MSMAKEPADEEQPKKRWLDTVKTDCMQLVLHLHAAADWHGIARDGEQ